MSAYFCEKTGVRIAKPGVSKLVDPVKGQELAEPPAEPAGEQSREQLVEELGRAQKHIRALEETLNDLGKEMQTEIEHLKASHAAALEQERGAHAAAVEAIKAAHAAELEQLTKPTDERDAPTAPDRPAGPPKKKNP
jgi:DNA anti-recombination protein RmuC